ncbi:MAG: TonB-dependent receptor [Flavobacterium sp.]|nr:MAG: TonB-dependent receptor [Flavobacterium sp.]
MFKYLLLFLFSIFLISAKAQNLSISGRVIDDFGKAKVNVNVNVKRLNVVVQTDSNGVFNFEKLASGKYKLVISAIGYATKTIDVQLETNHHLGDVKLVQYTNTLAQVTISEKLGETRRKQESLNVETVNADFIKRNLGGSLMKSLERLPGIKTIGIGSGQSKPLIRGLGFNRVVVVENGVKHEGQQWGADHGLEIDQFATDRVELIKGAASFVYGSDAIAGAIDIKPKAYPTKNSLGGSVDLVGKSNNNLYGTSVNLAGRNDKWFFDGRATFLSYSDYRVPTDLVQVYNYPVALKDNYVRNSAGRETNVHFSAGYLTEKVRSVFHVSNTNSKSGFFANAHGLEPRQVDLNLHDASNRDILMPNQQVNHLKLINRTGLSFNQHQIDIELGYQHNFRQEYSMYVNHGFMPAIYPDSFSIPQDLEREFDKRVLSANVKDRISLGKHQFSFGVNIENQDNGINGWSFLVPAFKQFTSGAFLYDKLELNDNLILHGALRYDYGQINISSYTDWFASDRTTATGTVSENLTRANALQRNFNSFIWSAGLNYNLSNFVFKANIGKSFRMPIAKELAANGVNYHYFSYEQGDPTLSPEKSYQLDMSFGYTDEKWSVQLSPFYNYFPNYIYLNPTSRLDYFYGAGNQVFQYAQSEVMRYGAELQAKYRFTDNLSTEFLGEYLYAKQLSGDKEGYTLPFSPPPSALLNLTYEPNFKGKFTGSYFSADYRLTARQNNIVPPEKKTAGYGIVNLAMGTKFKTGKQQFDISLQAQNLLNTKYLNHTSFYRLIELPEVGRNLVLSVKIPFSLVKND